MLFLPCSGLQREARAQLAQGQVQHQPMERGTGESQGSLPAKEFWSWQMLLVLGMDQLKGETRRALL